VSLLVSQAYSARPLRISYRLGGAPPALAVAYVLVPYALGIVAARGELRHEASALTVALFVLFTARIVLKDFRDRDGDRRFGKQTLLLRHGKTATCAVSLAGLVVADAVLAHAVDGRLWALLQLFACAIGWMLWRLWRASDPAQEQVAIGVGARMGNGLLLTVLTWRVTGGDAAASAVVAVAFLLSFGSLVTRLGDVAIGYKG